MTALFVILLATVAAFLTVVLVRMAKNDKERRAKKRVPKK